MKREPLLSYEDIYGDAGPAFATIDSDVRFVDFFMSRYEAARAKDAELIQMLVDEVAEWMQPNLDERFRGEQWHQSKRILAAAEAAGFTPSGE